MELTIFDTAAAGGRGTAAGALAYVALGITLLAVRRLATWPQAWPPSIFGVGRMQPAERQELQFVSPERVPKLTGRPRIRL